LTFFTISGGNLVSWACFGTYTILAEELSGTFTGCCDTLLVILISSRVVWACGNASTIRLKELSIGTDGSLASLLAVFLEEIFWAGGNAFFVARLERSGLTTGVVGEEGTETIFRSILVEFWACSSANTGN
jgi:hypothetical protein